MVAGGTPKGTEFMDDFFHKGIDIKDEPEEYLRTITSTVGSALRHRKAVGELERRKDESLRAKGEASLSLQERQVLAAERSATAAEASSVEAGRAVRRATVSMIAAVIAALVAVASLIYSWAIQVPGL